VIDITKDKKQLTGQSSFSSNFITQNENEINSRGQQEHFGWSILERYLKKYDMIH